MNLDEGNTMTSKYSVLVEENSENSKIVLAMLNRPLWDFGAVTEESGRAWNVTLFLQSITTQSTTKFFSETLSSVKGDVSTKIIERAIVDCTTFANKIQRLMSGVENLEFVESINRFLGIFDDLTMLVKVMGVLIFLKWSMIY
jgi:hypothetical protein